MKIVTVLYPLMMLVVSACHTSSKKTEPEYIGSQSCQSCHKEIYDLYKTSDHYHAMDTARAEKVKGDFNNVHLILNGDSVRFYKNGEDFYIRTADATGTQKKFRVSYTLGYSPLQQYLVDMDGKIQVLPFCWDTRPKEKGGQRWFHIYAPEKIPPANELHWTGINQNWNYMCADCHTTDFKKNYDTAHQFISTWRESRVSCESCHGPASGHLTWAQHPDKSKYNGFSISLATRNLDWGYSETGTAAPKRNTLNQLEIEVCARCHARATRLTDDYHHGQSLLQSHIPSGLNSVYYVDGQFHEEAYEYGSFLQSKMYAAGVACSNCHEPHSMKLKVTGNNLCATCHSPKKFNQISHTHHPLNSEGAQCINCHMPTATYMAIDERRDHSFRIPRPDLSLKLNTPNACNKCHTGKTVKWTAEHFLSWYKEKLPTTITYGELMKFITDNTAQSEPSLYQLLSSQYPAIVKGSALEQAADFLSPRNINQVLTLLQEAQPLLRLQALKALANSLSPSIITTIEPMLFDSIRTVRLEALSTLAQQQKSLSHDSQIQFKKVLKEYLLLQLQMSHRPEGYLNRCIVLEKLGNDAQAKILYQEGLKKFPRFIPFYLNLADLYRRQGNESRARQVLDDGIAIDANEPNLYYALGLWSIRQKNNEQGLAYLEKAALLNPKSPSFAYAWSIALFSMGDAKNGLKILETFITKNGNDPTVLDGIISIYQDLNNQEKANYYSAIRKQVYG